MITVNFGTDVCILDFDTIANAIARIRIELDFVYKVLEPGQQIVHTARYQMRDARNDFENHAQRLLDGSGAQNVAQLLTLVERTLNNIKLFPEESLQGKLIRDVFAEAPIKAAGIYAGFAGVYLDANATNGQFISGIALSQSIRSSATWETLADESLGTFRTRWERTLVENRELLAGLCEQFNGAIAKANKTAVQQSNDFQLACDGVQSRFSKIIDDTEGRISKTEKLFNAGLALRAPVKYWRLKQAVHTKRAIWWGVGFGIAAILAGFGVWLLVLELFSSGGAGASTMAAEIATPVWKTSALVIVATISIWALRILSRFLLTEMTLATDAESRAVMILTYLSMLKRGGATEQNVDLCLRSIFRAPPTANVKDDGSPPSVLGLISK